MTKDGARPRFGGPFLVIFGWFIVTNFWVFLCTSIFDFDFLWRIFVYLKYIYFCPGFVYFWFFVNFRWILYIAFLSRVLRKYGDPVNLMISIYNFDFLWRFFVYFQYIYFLSRVSLFYDILQIKCEFGTSILCPVFDVNTRIQVWGSNENEEALNILDAIWLRDYPVPLKLPLSHVVTRTRRHSRLVIHRFF